jgi:nucleoside-diphosphate-sugar epimerase
MKILVTGGGGFLGKAIVQQLIARGERVRSLARGAYPDLAALGVEVLRGDLTDRAVVFGAVEGCDAVIHVGAKAGFWGPYEEYYRANVLGTQNVINACQEHRIAKLVYTSSPSVIDHGQAIENGDESIPYPTEFVSSYSQTKAYAEQAILRANSPQLATVAIRPPLIWGPGDNHLVPRLIARAKAGRLVKISGPPAILDTTYIDNAAAAHLLALDHLSPTTPLAGQAYFISNGEPMDAFEIISKIVETAGCPPPSIRVPFSAAYSAAWLAEKAHTALGRSGEPPITRFLVSQLAKSRWFNISAARRDLGYTPQVSLAEGLARLAQALAAGSH